MKKWTFFIAAILCITSYTSTVLSVQNSNTDNYASQYISQPDYSVIGLANTTIPVDINGNQIITGNVRDGKSFQGNMPYNSPLSFNATLGSSTLSSFMRDSAGTEDLGRYLTNNISSTTGSNYQSYYLPSQTVTTLSQNKVGGTDYTNPVYTNGLQNRANPQAALNQNKTSIQQDLPRIPSPIEQYNAQTIEAQNQLNNLYTKNSHTNFQTRSETEDFSSSLSSISEQLSILQQDLNTNKLNKSTSSSGTMQSFVPNTQGYEIASTSELYSSLDDKLAADYPTGTTNPNSYQPGIVSQSTRSIQPQYQPNNITGTTQYPATSLDEIKRKLDDLTRSIDTHMQSVPNNSNQYQVANPALRLEEQHTNFQSYAQSQFNKHFNIAREQLKMGRYFEAADSFTLAAIYEPDNLQCYAGQGHALFAAGQFVSSALYIIRAIEINPEYIHSNVDLASITGGPNMLAGRIAELEQFIQKGPATGLQFLLAYTYYLTGRFTDAKHAIDTVYQDMPQSRAVVALKFAIDTKLSTLR